MIKTIPVQSPLRGIAFMITASASFAVMNAFAASLARDGFPWQTAGCARGFLGFVFALIIARMRGASLRIIDGRTMWIRSIAGTTGMLCTFYALANLPLSDATALFNTTPLWIAALAFVTLRERPGAAVLVAIAIAAAGIVLIERPSIAAGNLAGLIALGAGAAGALAMVSLRRLSGETPEAIVVHFSAFATVAMMLLLGLEVAHRGGHPSIGVAGGAKLLAVGLAGTAGQLSLTRAYALDRAARIGAAGWIQVVFALLIDMVVLQRYPPGLTVAGIALIIAAGVLLVIDASRAPALNPNA